MRSIATQRGRWVATMALLTSIAALGCGHRQVDYGGVAVLEGKLLRAKGAESAVQRSAHAVAIIETDVARGMGFVIDPSGYLITNRHVIEDAERIEGVFFPALDASRIYGNVRVVYIDPDRDLALLHVRSSEPLSSVPLATADLEPVSEYLAYDDPVVLVQREGRARGSMSLALQHGQVSTLEAYNPAAGHGAFVGLTPDVREGQSGGPVLDRHGRVVGVVTWTWRDRGGGYAIPIVEAMRMLAERPKLDSEADQQSRVRLRAGLFLDALARGDGEAARRFTSPSEARKRGEQTVEEIMGQVQEGEGLELMQSYVAALEAVVDEVQRSEDLQVAERGLQSLVLGAAQPQLREVLGLTQRLDQGQVISFFLELGHGYLRARVFGNEEPEGALRTAFQRLRTVEAARSFALADLALALGGREAQMGAIELVPTAYAPMARVELSLPQGGGEAQRYDLYLRLEWGDFYVSQLVPAALG